MTELEAVNEMWEWCGQPPLESIAAPEAVEALTTLNRISKEIQQEREWFVGIEELSLGVPDTKIAVSGGTGTFSYGETVTESVSGATGTFDHILSGFMYINSVSGTFTGGQTLTGGTSGATKTGAAYTAITTSRIALNPDEIIRIKPSSIEGESQRIVTRGPFFWDAENSTYDFTESLDLTVVRLLDIDEMTNTLAVYIVKEAAWNFMRYKMPGRVDSENRYEEMLRAKAAAMTEDAELRGSNILNSSHSRDVKGRRDGDAIVW